MINIKKISAVGIIAVMLILHGREFAFATASTHIWAPSTDAQAYGTGHITADMYIPVEHNSDGSRPNAITNTGLTFGALPFKRFNAEVGFDYKTGYGDLDSYPIYFNAKIAVPEDAYGAYFPAVAGGIYDIGTRSGKTDCNIVYGKLAKTVKLRDFLFGRLSIGYFWGNGELLLDGDGDRDNHGILAAWERTMTELSDKLWAAVEYQGTESSYGAFNLGISWQFTSNISVICGYQFYNNRNLADTATIQVDVNF